jgi:hypothetical protein
MKISRPAATSAFVVVSLLASRLGSLLVGPGCSPASGGSGQACIVGGSLLQPTYSCNGSLVCNTGESPPLCETANIQSAGGPCGQPDNCESGLFCNEKTCEVLLTAGQSCPTGLGCAPGLVCEKTPAPICVAADAAAPDASQPGGNASGGDAADSGGD